ncbi:hypothetical protein AURDEDRAFT_156120 [Auricularia subglabra TFB-10046 SS5]|nr:hypothetical protein AURDEDRAFT_156120 [Auricularia subglabra TFB-10046 SS5]
MPFGAKEYGLAMDDLVHRRTQPPKRAQSKNRWVFWVIYSSVLLLASRLSQSVSFYLPRFDSIGKRATADGWNFSVLSRNGSLDFFQCPDLPNLECTNVVVPKDYFDPSAGTSTVAVAVLRGNAQTKKGSIFINPGMWPRRFWYLLCFSIRANSMDFLSEIVQGEYDIVGFDPRGVANSRPVVQCFPTKFDYQVFQMGTVLERGFNLPPHPSSPAGFADIQRQWSEWRSLFAAQYHICGEALGNELKYMGTATVVRDIEYMASLFDGPGAPIHFFGGSYGTILGAYLVNMLPDRAGRVIIDGVADPVSWANAATNTWMKDWLVDTEKAYQRLLEECVKAGAGRCTLAEKGASVSDIAARIDKYLSDLYYNPVPISNHSRPGILTAGLARLPLYYATNAPMKWPYIASAYAQALSGDPTPLYDFFATPPQLPPTPDPNGDLARSAVSCADSDVSKRGASAKELAHGTLEVLKVTPRFALSPPTFEPDGACEFWPTKGREPERFTGPFNHTLANPMLILSALIDPITPLASARTVKKLMPESSRLVIQDTLGHSTHAMGMSTCAAKILRAYYFDGTLPQNELHCPGDHGIFDTTEERQRGLQTMSVEDRRLSEMLSRSSDAVVRMRAALRGFALP